MSETEIFKYKTHGTCSQMIAVKIKDGLIEDIAFAGGCQGNLTGIRMLARGAKIDDIIDRLSGIDCGGKGTSCPDQLARCLIAYKAEKGIK